MSYTTRRVRTARQPQHGARRRRWDGLRRMERDTAIEQCALELSDEKLCCRPTGHKRPDEWVLLQAATPEPTFIQSTAEVIVDVCLKLSRGGIGQGRARMGFEDSTPASPEVSQLAAHLDSNEHQSSSRSRSQSGS